MEKTLSEQLLPALLEMTACTTIRPSTCQLAYIVAAQYMARVRPQVIPPLCQNNYCVCVCVLRWLMTLLRELVVGVDLGDRMAY